MIGRLTIEDGAALSFLKAQRSPIPIDCCLRVSQLHDAQIMWRQQNDRMDQGAYLTRLVTVIGFQRFERTSRPDNEPHVIPMALKPSSYPRRIRSMFTRLSALYRWMGVRAVVLMLAHVASTHASPVAFQAFPNNSTHSSAAVAQAIGNVPTNVGVVYDPIGQTNDIQIYNFSALVYTGFINVGLTLDRIRHGDWISTESNDGGFFNFKSGELPNIPRMGNNYYMEFVVWPSLNVTNGTYDPSINAFGTVAFPGPMRLLIGLGGEVYFTGDHYGSGLQKNAYYVNPTPAFGTFRITNITREANNVRITWQTVGGTTNVVQTAAGASGGSSNNFSNLSPIIVPNGGDLTSTNFLDVGAATNFPARYYRVRVGQ